ncbi:hypothetical protein BD626DRAFT_480863 [Schizophyllum amplum]|uniref:Uncharacterized protein n=1 Tax=Schizophyllum amplum TaxID=97359 RepID=A0A550CTL4_9AGAR|nr:hypothetical protein BD626DRAFT_480863 [Auriculariopsis ampla]
MLPSARPALTRPALTRSVSSSPYGRTHVWKRGRAPTLPAPVVPKYPQRVIRADGTSFTHYTTSPRSFIRLARDVTNNPVWNTSLWLGESGGIDDENAITGRLGRFSRRFGDDGIDKNAWMEQFENAPASAMAAEPAAPAPPPAPKVEEIRKGKAALKRK